MLAFVEGPIVTDFVPAVKPPWLVLAVFVVLVFAFIPRESLGLALLALGMICGIVALFTYRNRTINSEQ